MRSRTQVLVKRVYTLEFERSVEDSVELAAELFAKLDSARRRRSVVCASPEALKSLSLKFIEHLHALEQVDPGDVAYSASSHRQNKEVGKIREALEAKSAMADGLVRIMDIWRSGVLIMDEVSAHRQATCLPDDARPPSHLCRAHTLACTALPDLPVQVDQLLHPLRSEVRDRIIQVMPRLPFLLLTPPCPSLCHAPPPPPPTDPSLPLPAQLNFPIGK